MGEREGERGFGELGLARQCGRLEQSGFVLGQGLERAEGADGRPPHFVHSSRELRALGQPIGNKGPVAIFSDVGGKTQLHRKVIGKARTGVSTRPVIGVVRLNRDRGFSNKRTGQRGRNIHTVEAGRVGKRTGDV